LNAVIADTGPLYAETDIDDQYHERSRDELIRLNEDKFKIIIPYPILLEAHKLVLFKCGISAADAFVKRLATNTNLLNPMPQDYQQAFKLIRQFPDQKITIFDALVAVLSKQTGFPVWTYDYHFDVMNIHIWRAYHE
jgi:predicted nucleic acid-binding protein